MNEPKLTVLERAWADIPVDPVPIDALWSTGRAARRRRRTTLIGGGAAATVVLSGGFLATQALDADDPQGVRNPTAGRTGPLGDGGAASCVESYTPQAVTNRAFAFDGTVVAIGPGTTDRGDESDLNLIGVTFQVHDWYAGGGGGTITVDMQPSGQQVSTSQPETAYGLGSRLLISGEPRWGGSPLDDPIAWGCGFSRYYDPATAASWDRAFAR